MSRKVNENHRDELLKRTTDKKVPPNKLNPFMKKAFHSNFKNKKA